MRDNTPIEIDELLKKLDISVTSVLSEGTLIACGGGLALYSYGTRLWLFGTKLDDDKVGIHDVGEKSKIEKVYAFDTEFSKRIANDVIDGLEDNVFDEEIYFPEEMFYIREERTLYISIDIGYEGEEQVLQLGVEFKERDISL